VLTGLGMASADAGIGGGVAAFRILETFSVSDTCGGAGL
jgi:hypothetical protein